MFDVKTYIKLVMKKKKLTYEEFCNRINTIKREIGDTGQIKRSNVSEILNTNRGFEEKTLLIFEKALGLPMDTLVNMNKKTVLYTTKRDNKELRKVLKSVKDYK